MILIIDSVVHMRKTNNLVSAFVSLIVLASCSSASDPTSTNESIIETTSDSVVAELPVIAVTYSVIGDIVSQLVGDRANVKVVVPDGQDPHEFQPSAKDIEIVNNAALVVSNGLEFEEGLEEVLESITDSGGNIFMVGEHITVRKIEDGGEHGGEVGNDHGDKHAGGDPHLCL